MRYEIEWTDGYVRGSTGAAEGELEGRIQRLFDKEDATSITLRISKARGY